MALSEIVPSLNSALLSDEQKNTIYEKVLNYIGKTNLKFQTWWKEKSLKYQWKSSENGNWSVDFDTNEIFLNTQ